MNNKVIASPDRCEREMLRNIKVEPLAAESLGVRSMCTYVQTKDVKLLLDAGVSLCPKRFGLPPHPVEFKEIIGCRKKIAEAAQKAEIVTISHYHFAHHTPSYGDWLSQWTEPTETARQIYEKKTVLLKNARDSINYSQRRRGWMFQKTAGRQAEALVKADGKKFVFGETSLKFSEPVFHGPEDSSLGWVLMLTVERGGEKFMFAPDVQGPMSIRTLKIILDEKPDVLVLGGPPLYLVGFKVDERQMKTALDNLEEIVAAVPLTLLEHHVLRDESWREKTVNVFNEAQQSEHAVQTAAEFLGRENVFLEANRRKLFSQDSPSEEFQKWMGLNEEMQKHVKPPV